MATVPVLLLFTIAFFTPEHNGAEATLSFKDQCVKWHNDYRDLHQVDGVTWNDTLAKGAEDWAKYLAENNLFKHASNIKPGENLYLSSHIPTEPCTAATKAFYEEVKDYDFNKPGFSMQTGHFTQVVWKNTKEIGAASATRQDGKFVVVIRYFPGGNYLGEQPFRKNVLPPKDWQPPTEAAVGQIRPSFAFSGFVLVVGFSFKYYF